jgi:hypothetical protein
MHLVELVLNALNSKLMVVHGRVRVYIGLNFPSKLFIVYYKFLLVIKVLLKSVSGYSIWSHIRKV